MENFPEYFKSTNFADNANLFILQLLIENNL